MKTLKRTSQFKKDVKRVQKRGKDFDVFRDVIANLAAAQPLDPTFRVHSLVGQYTGTRECHIEPDWLLIYESTDDEIVLIRTGSHADLFK